MPPLKGRLHACSLHPARRSSRSVSIHESYFFKAMTSRQQLICTVRSSSRNVSSAGPTSSK
jgi:hypothetical protein